MVASEIVNRTIIDLGINIHGKIIIYTMMIIEFCMPVISQQTCRDVHELPSIVLTTEINDHLRRH